MEESRYYLLYLRDGRVRAADGTPLMSGRGEYPRVLNFGGHEYRRYDDEDIFCFWDELRDASDATVGFTFQFLENQRKFLKSSLFCDAENATVSDHTEGVILLRDCDEFRYEDVQGFDFAIYQSVSDFRSCVLIMFDRYENIIGFPLEPVPGGVTPVPDPMSGL